MSSLAITDRKTNTQKPGRCVGIFFQLFDWNRRFSKKKFFPKKLLPPARTKVSKKFNADEKLPVGKHLLIAAHENNGGFPSNVKQNAGRGVGFESKKHEMRTPGLVARLMGLEAVPVPVVDQGNSNKGSPSDDCKGKCGKLDGVSVKMDSSPEKGNLRPQKLQKTGVSERHPVTRLGVEALQIKNALSRSRKHHHVKLTSPVKSPKLGRNTSRLIDAAARILEPGIQATNRARCRLTYPNSMIQSHEKDVMTEMNVDMDLEFQSDCKFSSAQNSCRSCGNLLKRGDARSVMTEQTTGFEVPASRFREDFLRGVEESRPRPAVYLENETEVVLLKTRYQADCACTMAEENQSVENELNRNTMHQYQYHNQMPASRTFTSQKNASTSYNLNHSNQRRSQMLIGEKVPPRSKPINPHARRVSSAANAVPENKDFIALNRNASRTQVRVPDKFGSSIERDRRFCAGKNDSLVTQRSPVRKRRTLDVNRPVDATGSANSLLEKQRSHKGNIMAQNRSRAQANSGDPTYVINRPVSQRGSRETDVVSFTFSSPVKSGVATFSHNDMGAHTRNRIGQFSDENLQDKTVKDDNGIKKCSQNLSRINGDALEALLEQKLKELRNQVENESASGFMPSGRTTASILQELISALTAERPVSQDDGAQSGGDCVDRFSPSRMKTTSDSFSCKVDHFSPGCVIDASFSNESCISSSFDDSSGRVLRSDWTDLPAYADADLSDSASSTNNARGSYLIAMTDLLTHISAVLQNVNLVHMKLTGTKLDFVQEIVLSAELLFGNGTLQASARFVDFLVGPFLDELEALVIAAWKNSVILGLEVRKEESPLRRFLFDTIIECLDVRYNRYSNSGCQAWSRLPKSLNADVLVKVFDEEVRKWIAFSGKAPDEIIEREMSISLGKWTDFEIEAFETASLINQELVQTLVDEIVIDLVGCDLSFC